jgi:hypothetical protein
MGLIRNSNHPKYNQHTIDETAELFDTYDVDGVFLDDTLRQENRPNYSPDEGLIQYPSPLGE